MFNSSDAELVRAACAGRREAFGLLIERYQPLAERIARRMIAREEVARELVQEALLAAYLSLAQLREPERFKAWLYSIVLNVCRSHLREQRTDVLSLDELLGGLHYNGPLFPESLLDPQEVAEEQELQRLVHSAVQQLPPRERSATLLFYYEQLTLQEIAGILDISVAAVKSRLFQARRRLRRRLAASVDLPESAKVGKRPERSIAMAQVIIEGVRKNLLTGQSVVTLLEEATRRLLYIWVGRIEGLVIAAALQKVQPPRPLAIHFTANLLKELGIRLEEVRVESLNHEVFFAVAKVHNGSDVREIDVRPSDALTLALLLESPIYVADALLERIGAVLPEGKTLDEVNAEEVITREGIPLPAGKTLGSLLEEVKGKDLRGALSGEDILKELNEALYGKTFMPSAEEVARAKRAYLASRLGIEESGEQQSTEGEK